MTRVRHKSDTSATQTARVRHECYKNYTSVTRVKNFDFDNDIFSHKKVKTYFHTATFTIWQVEDYKERNNFILRTNFWKCPFPMPKCV